MGPAVEGWAATSGRRQPVSAERGHASYGAGGKADRPGREAASGTMIASLNLIVRSG